MKHARGFTIVELLIVIVVIAILAAISIVAYNGIQSRAYNTQILSIVRTYRTALDLYAASEAGATKYPQVELGMQWGQCLGTGYTLNGDHCWSGPSANVRESSTFNGLLAAHMPTPPTISSPRYYIINSQGDQRTGAAFIRGTYTNPSESPRIEYLLHGANQDCALAGATRTNPNWFNAGVTRCELNLPI